MAKRTPSKINTEEFIGLLPERAALWQKGHPEFQNRDVRDALLREMADILGVSVNECKDRLKYLKDTMRKHVNALPKTKSGAPAYDKSSQVTWPYFTKLLFMKDEFVGRKMVSSHHEDTQSIGQQSIDSSEEEGNQSDEEGKEDDLLEQAMQKSGVSPARHPSEASTSSSSYFPKRKRCIPAYSDPMEKEKINLLKESIAISRQKMDEKKDPLDVFAMDLANDLRQIEDKRLLIKTKMELKKITSQALLQQIEATSTPEPTLVQQNFQHIQRQYSNPNMDTHYPTTFPNNVWPN